MRLARTASLLLATLLVIGCGGDGGTGPDGDDNTMTASVAGAAWNGSLAVQASRAGNVFSVSGTNGTYQIQLTVPNVTATGTYNFGPGNAGIAQVVQVTAGFAAWTSALVGGTGTLTIATLTAEGATGTFTFNGIASPGTPATGTRAVTNGSFEVSF
jgi:hypothetical protein